MNTNLFSFLFVTGKKLHICMYNVYDCLQLTQNEDIHGLLLLLIDIIDT